MKSEGLVVDADGHILEPPDLWEKYLEPKYRPKAIRVTVGDDGYEYLEVGGGRSSSAKGARRNCATSGRVPRTLI
jgi:hypothetical protein